MGTLKSMIENGVLKVGDTFHEPGQTTVHTIIRVNDDTVECVAGQRHIPTIIRFMQEFDKYVKFNRDLDEITSNWIDGQQQVG